MSNYREAVETLLTIDDHAHSVVIALKALRDGTSDEAWDELFDGGLLDTLLCAVCDLEEAVDGEE